MIKHDKFIQRAVLLSREGMRSGKGGPFGAVVVKNGKIIGEGFNQVTSTNDPTAHAEIVAIRNACKHLGTFSLQGCEIYCSCEPCPMCLSAIYWAHIEKIYYANSKFDAAAIGFDDAFIYEQLAKSPEARSIALEKVHHSEAIKVFEEWKNMTNKIPY
jgi:tRNA(Arg) A34 adenosine deaminase TadA